MPLLVIITYSRAGHTDYGVTVQLADAPTRGLPTRGLVNSRTGQVADWTTRGLADAAKRTKTKHAKSPVASASCPVTHTEVGTVGQVSMVWHFRKTPTHQLLEFKGEVWSEGSGYKRKGSGRKARNETRRRKRRCEVAGDLSLIHTYDANATQLSSFVASGDVN